MSVITRNRTIRPSTRGKNSNDYKIDTKNISTDDYLVVNIYHEANPLFRKTYNFNGANVANKNCIHFKVDKLGNIIWSGAQPIEKDAKIAKAEITSLPVKKSAIKVELLKKSIDFKKSFNPISNSYTRILILGSLPGDASILRNQYYGHTRNRFWKIISAITDNELPATYPEKQALLLKSKIGIWDVAHSANRKGSLDSAIYEENPNDLDNFISKHKDLKVIGFNGKKSEKMFDKYFKREKEITYISLPSSSPVNTGIEFETICKQWQKLLN